MCFRFFWPSVVTRNPGRMRSWKHYRRGKMPPPRTLGVKMLKVVGKKNLKLKLEVKKVVMKDAKLRVVIEVNMRKKFRTVHVKRNCLNVITKRDRK
jgi:hypothetical protein